MSKVLTTTLLALILVGVPLESWAFDPGSARMRSAVDNMARNVRRQVRQALKPRLVINEKAKKHILGVVQSSGDRYIATLHDGQVMVWDLTYGMPLVRSDADVNDAGRSVLSEDGRYLLAAGPNGGLLEYTLQEDGLQANRIPAQAPVRAMAYVEGTNAWVTGDASGGIQIWKAGAGNAMERVQLGGDSICCAAALRGANKVIVGAGSKLVTLALNDQPGIETSWDLQTPISKLQVSATGRTAAVVSGSQLLMLDLKQGEIRWQKSVGGDGWLPLGFAGEFFYGWTGDQELQAFRVADGSVSDSKVEDIKSKTKSGMVAGDALAMLVGDDGLIYGVDLRRGKLVMRWVVTDEGWTVLDERGRFDGTAEGVREIAWAAAKRKIDLASFADDYYEPGLLKQLVTRKKHRFVTKAGNVVEDGIYLPPEVKVDVKRRGGDEVEVKVVATAKNKEDFEDVRALYLYHNGKRAPDGGRIKQKKDKGDLSVTWTYRTRLQSGGNTFEAAVSGWGNIRAKSGTISVSGGASGAEPTLAVTSVGINEYADEDLLLNYAVADATAVAQTFYKDVGRKLPQRIKTLVLDENARGAGLREQLANLADYQPNDVLVMFLSGHGVAIGEDWYFLPQDAESLGNERHIKAIGISGKELADALTRAPAQKIFLAVDTCQSGAVLGSFETFIQRKALQQLSDDAGIHIMTATRADQLAPEYHQLKHGLFTFTMLKGLTRKGSHYNADKWPRDGRLTVGELKRYVMKYSPVLAKMMEVRAGRAGVKVLVSPAQLSGGHDFTLD